MQTFLSLTLILMIYGCAARKVVIKNADTLISYQINKKLHLQSQQKQELQKDIDQFLNQKKTLGPEVLRLFENIDLNSPPSIEEKFKKGELIVRKISEDFSSILSTHMSQLDEKQQKLFFESLASDNEDIEQKSKKEREEDLNDRLEFFIGDVEKKQKETLQEFKDYFELRNQQRLSGRVKLQEKFKTIFTQNSTAESKKLLFQEAFAQYQKESFDQNRTLEFMLKILLTLDADQRKHLLGKVVEFKEITEIYLNTQY